MHSTTRAAGFTATLSIVALGLTCVTHAIYMQQQLESVPIERLVGNLARMAANEPKDPQLRVNLARAHAMAYASKATTVQVVAKQERNGVWFGYEPPYVPFSTVKSATDPAAQKTARAHLGAAIVAYREALALEPGNTEARLGYGWCLQEAGDRSGAVDAYRRVIAEEWPRDQTRRFFMAGRGAMTEEAADYLIPLLDPVKDSQEITRLRQYTSELSKRGRAITPIAIPLVPDTGSTPLVDWSVRVRFDADGLGLDREWTWISKDAGWLVYDHRGSGRITSALQLFGNVTFWMFWANGYEAMRALDDNQDGRLEGPELTGLAIWQDANRNGVSDPGEVASLDRWGITALSCDYRSEDESDVFVAYSPGGVTFADGTRRATYDLLLHPR